MWVLIACAVVGTLFVIGIYQMMLKKYYWGPGGKPPEQTRHQSSKKR